MRLIDKHTPQIPQACAACYRQPLDREWVDFDVYHDGGTLIEGDSEDVLQRRALPVDDLILCSDCIEQAAKLIGLGRVDDVRAELAQVRAEREAAVGQAAEHKAFSDSLRAALALAPEEGTPAPTPRPRTNRKRTA